MNPLVILHVNTEAGWRGGEAQTLLLARGLRLRGHRSILAVRRGGALDERARADGFDVGSLPMRNEWDLGSAIGLARLIRASRPQVLHYHTSHAITIGTAAGLIAAPLSGRIPAVLTRRVSFSLKRNPFARIKYRYRIDHVISVADGVRWVLIREGISPEQVTVIHSGIELSRFAAASPESRSEALRRLALPLRPGATLIGTVGALVDHKGHEFLIRALGHADGPGPEARAVLIGDGPLRQMLEDLARRLGLEERIHFAGYREDVPGILPAFDLFALPSVSGEGSPAVVKEAMACGIPIVATDLEGVQEIVSDGVEALLVPPGSAAALAGALRRLAADAALRARLVAQAREKVKDYSAERMVERTEEVYARLLRQRRPP